MHIAAPSLIRHSHHSAPFPTNRPPPRISPSRASRCGSIHLGSLKPASSLFIPIRCGIRAKVIQLPTDRYIHILWPLWSNPLKAQSLEITRRLPINAHRRATCIRPRASCARCSAPSPAPCSFPPPRRLPGRLPRRPRRLRPLPLPRPPQRPPPPQRPLGV